jgi:hypothetical protein
MLRRLRGPVLGDPAICTGSARVQAQVQAGATCTSVSL